LFPDFNKTAEEQNHAKRNKSCGTIERRKRSIISKKQNYTERNKSCGTKEQRKRTKISKGTKPCTREQICGTTEQTNEGNVRFFVQNSPTSEADQNFDQFISPSHPKHCTKSWTSPSNLKKAGAPAREPKSVREQNHIYGNKSAEQRNKTNGPVTKSLLKIPSVKWKIDSARAPGSTVSLKDFSYGLGPFSCVARWLLSFSIPSAGRGREGDV
jgi:hypothetical protein